MTLKLLTEHYLESLSLKEGSADSSESTLVKMPHCWKSHAMAHFFYIFLNQSLHSDSILFMCTNDMSGLSMC